VPEVWRLAGRCLGAAPLPVTGGAALGAVSRRPGDRLPVPGVAGRSAPWCATLAAARCAWESACRGSISGER